MKVSLTGTKVSVSLRILALFSPVFIASIWIVTNCFKGIDLTDEGMYILSATAKNQLASFHNPYADYTSLLLKLSGGQIWLFRLLGVAILEVCGCWLGLTINSVLNSSTNSTRKWVLVSGGLTIGVFYYATGLITPSYNWLNLVSLVIGAVGCIRLLDTQKLNHLKCVQIGLILSISSWLGLFAKFTSALGIAIIATLVVLVTRKSLRETLFLLGSVLSFFALFVVMHNFLIEPWNVTLEKFSRGKQILILLDPGYNNTRALQNFESGVIEWFQKVPNIDRPTSLLLIILLILTVSTSLVKHKRSITPDNVYIRSVVAASTAIALYGTYKSGLWAGYSLKYINQMWAVSCLLISSLVLAIIACLISRTFSSLTIRKGLSIFILFGGAVLYAIGSGNGFIAQLTGASGLILLAAVALPLALEPLLGGFISLCIAIAGAVGSAETTRQANLYPYRQAPRSVQNEWLNLGNGHGSVMVDGQLRELVLNLRSSLLEAGWEPQTPMLDLTKYSAGLLFLLDAKPPVTIIPTVGMYPTVDVVMNWAVKRTLVDEGRQWTSAWLLTPSDKLVNPTDGRPNPNVVSLLGHVFPADYQAVAESNGYTVWKPKETSIHG